MRAALLRIFLTIWCLVLIVLAQARGQSECFRAKESVFSKRVQLNNSVEIDAILDTGATDLVVICDDAMRSLGLPPGKPIEIQTASGMRHAQEVEINSVRLGQIEVRRVPSIVSNQTGPCRILLGMSFIRKLGSLTIKGDRVMLIGRRRTRRCMQ